jgi:hypothetical protein
MVLFAIAYSIAEFAIVCIAIFQFFAALITGSVNEPLLRFGNNLSTYIYQVFQYQTFNSEVRPFPFSDWPDEPHADNAWLKDPQPVEDPSAPAAASTPTPAPAPEKTPEKAPVPPVPATPSIPSGPASDSDQNVDDSGHRSDDDRIR